MGLFGDSSCNSWAYFGKQGAGKTLGMIDLAIKLAVKRRRGIVSNLRLNPQGFYDYGRKYKLPWLQRIATEGQIISLPTDSEMDLLFRYPYSIVVFDEAGALMFSRNWQKSNDSIIKSGIQLRKNYCNLIWTAQYADQADKFLRSTVERCVWSEGVSFFNWQSQKDILIWRSNRHFEAREFWAWVDNDELRSKHVKTALKSLQHDSGMVTQRHKDLFNCFDSHGLVGSTSDANLQPIITNYLYRCDLPKSYYQSKIHQPYDDPILNLRFNYKLIPLEQELKYYSNHPDGFFAPPIIPSRIATACHLKGYFEIDKPLPIYHKQQNQKYQQPSSAKTTHYQNSNNSNGKVRTIDPRIQSLL
jgi:hypothetical protein